MHDTQTINTNRSELCAIVEFLGRIVSINDLNTSQEIEFDSIKVETEFILTKEKSNTMDFIGDTEESTEIESIVFPLNSTITSLKLSTGEENTETDEILTILKQKSPRDNTNYASNPELNTARKVSLIGRVLKVGSHVEPTLQHRCSLPIRPRCVPQRVSNPFYKNFDSLTCNNKINNKVNDNISQSKQF